MSRMDGGTLTLASILLLLIMTSCLVSSASYQEEKNIKVSFFIDPLSGSDTNDGRSPDTAWRTLANLNDVDPSPGDDILFRRGTVLSSVRGVVVGKGGSISNPIRFSTYGDGPKPVIDLGGSKANGFYIYENYVTVENIIIKNAGNQAIFIGDNPSGTYGLKILDCEAYNISGSGVLHSGGGGDILIDGFVCNNSGNSGIGIMGSIENRVHNVTIKGCWISNATTNDGITIHEGDSTPRMQAGSGFLLENNHVQYSGEDGYDITTGRNIRMINNTSYRNCISGIQLGHSATDIEISSHTSLEESTIENSGSSIVVWVGNVTIRDSIFDGGNYHTMYFVDAYKRGLNNISLINNYISWKGKRDMIWFEDVITNLTVINNIFYSEYPSSNHIQFTNPDYPPGHDSSIFENNIYFSEGGFSFSDFNDGQFNLSAFRSRYGKEQKGIEADPLLIRGQGPFFEISPSSPVIDRGMPGVYHQDFFGHHIYGNRDIGPIEYQPPFDIRISPITDSSKIRVYSDGHYRVIEPDNLVDNAVFSIEPLIGWMSNDQHGPRNACFDLSLKKWDDTEPFQRKFILSFIEKGNVYRYNLSGFPAETNVDIVINNRTFDISRSSPVGSVSFEFGMKVSEAIFEVRISDKNIEMIDLSPFVATTGDEFRFTYSIYDIEGIERVWLNHRYDDILEWENTTMELISGSIKDGRWEISIPVRSDSTNDLIYMVGTRSMIGRISITRQIRIPVYDNDPPEIISVGFPQQLRTGEMFKLNVSTLDNIGIARIIVRVSSNGNRSFYEYHLTEQPYIFELNSPESSFHPLWITVVAIDRSGNQALRENNRISVNDGDAPWFFDFFKPRVLLAGTTIEMWAIIEDNDPGIHCFLEHWSDFAPISHMALGSSEGKFSGDLVIDFSGNQQMFYRYFCIDSLGNNLSTSIYSVNIVEKMQKEPFMWIISPGDEEVLSGITIISVGFLNIDLDGIVNIVMDGTIVRSISKGGGSSSVTISFDTTIVKDGQHLVNAVYKRDLETDQLDSSPIGVYIDNGISRDNSISIGIIPRNISLFVGERIVFEISFQQADLHDSAPSNIWFTIGTVGSIDEFGEFVALSPGHGKIRLEIRIGNFTIRDSVDLTVMDGNISVTDDKWTLERQGFILISLIIFVLLVLLIIISTIRSRRASYLLNNKETYE